MTSAISISGVVKRFGKFTAVDRLDLEVPLGVTFGLLGPNGAGKTTTIRMIMNITKPDEGTIRVLGEPMGEELQERIGYLPEERGLYRKMKVVDQLLFFAAIKSVDKDDRDEAPRAVDRLDGPAPVARRRRPRSCRRGCSRRSSSSGRSSTTRRSSSSTSRSPASTRSTSSS